MSLSIKNPETVRLARELARLRGQGITQALTDALRRALQRDDRKKLRRAQKIAQQYK